MEQALHRTLPLSTPERARAAKRHSVSFVVSVMLLTYALVVSYIDVIFNEFDKLTYYVQLIGMMLILFYLAYNLVKDVAFKNYRLNLIFIYCLFIIFHYMLLQSGLERVLRLLTLILGITALKKFPFNRAEIKQLYYLFAITVLLFILNGTTVENKADPTKFNPNGCAAYLMLLFCISIVMFANRKRALYLIIAAVCFALQFFFISRGATAGCILFAIAFIAFKAWKRKWKVKTAFIIILLLSMLGILAAYFYSTVLYDAIGRGQVTILGKDLFTGRQKIWRLTFESMHENLWFGVGSRINEATVLEESNSIYRDAHNMALAVFASFGLIHFILFYLLLSYLVSVIGVVRTKKGKYILRAPVIFMSVITLMSYFDALFFSRWVLPMIIVAYGFICGATPVRKTVAALPDKKRACHG